MLVVGSLAMEESEEKIDNLQRQRASEKSVCETHDVIDEGEFYSLDAIIFRCTIVMLSLSLCHCF